MAVARNNGACDDLVVPWTWSYMDPGLWSCLDLRCRTPSFMHRRQLKELQRTVERDEKDSWKTHVGQLKDT